MIGELSALIPAWLSDRKGFHLFRLWKFWPHKNVLFTPVNSVYFLLKNAWWIWPSLPNSWYPAQIMVFHCRWVDASFFHSLLELSTVSFSKVYFLSIEFFGSFKLSATPFPTADDTSRNAYFAAVGGPWGQGQPPLPRGHDLIPPVAICEMAFLLWSVWLCLPLPVPTKS